MRLFVALDIPEDVRSSLAAFVARLRALSPSARWVRMEGVHVTLKFIGEAPADQLNAIKAALANLPARAPFANEVSRRWLFSGSPPPARSVGRRRMRAELAVLAADVDSALAALGIPREDRAFSPHLTLARFDESRGLDAIREAIEKSGPLDFGSATAESFHLYQSVLKRGGAEYTRLATYSFTGSEAE